MTPLNVIKIFADCHPDNVKIETSHTETNYTLCNMQECGKCLAKDPCDYVSPNYRLKISSQELEALKLSHPEVFI